MGNTAQMIDVSLDFTLNLEPAQQVAQPGSIDDRLEIGEGFDSNPDHTFVFTRRRRATPPRLPGAPVLIVEDDEVTRAVVEKVLTQDGYPVRAAWRKDQISAALVAPPLPALILLDLQLPDIDGFFLLSRLKKHDASRNIPVVLLTGRALNADLMRALGGGADGYLTKPCKVDTLRRAIRTVLPG